MRVDPADHLKIFLDLGPEALPLFRYFHSEIIRITRLYRFASATPLKEKIYWFNGAGIGGAGKPVRIHNATRSAFALTPSLQ